MKHIIFTILLIILAGCSSSQYASYRPQGSNDSNWQIYVEKSFSNTFTVTINDSIVIEKSLGLFSHSMDCKSSYKNKEVRLVVNYVEGFLGIGSGFETLVFVNNELAAKFKI